MCLNSKTDVRKRVVDQLKKQGFIVGYKVVRRVRLDLWKNKSPFILHSDQRKHTWIKGWNYSSVYFTNDKGGKTFDPSSTEIRRSPRSPRIEAGFHVYLDKPKKVYFDERTIPVMCFEQDFIAAGVTNATGPASAVFSKVFIRNDSYNSAIKVTPKKKK